MTLFVPTDMGMWVGSPYQTPIARVLIGGQTALRVTGVQVDLGFGTQSSRATFTVVGPTLPTWAPGNPVTIALGFAGLGGGFQPVFGGEVVTVDLSYFPHRVQVEAQGYLRRLDPTYEEEGFAYSSVTDGFIWTELMRKSLIPRYQTGPAVDEGITYGGRRPVEVAQQGTPRELVDKLDASSPGGFKTFEVQGIVMRTRVAPIPAANASFRYAQGAAVYPVLRLLEVRRRDTVADLNNRVIVEGLQEADGTRVYADRRADSPYVPQDPDGYFRDSVFTFSSDIIENRDHCDLLAQRYMSEQNRRREELELRVPLNPYLMPGHTIGLTAEKIGLSTERNYWIMQVGHEYGASGAFSRVELVGGAGDTGYLIGLDPVAAFTFTVTSEAYLVGGVPTRVYSVALDGSPSFDPDGAIVSYAWSASTGATGTGATWSVGFTEAEWNASPTVTLTVTDGDTDPTGPHTNSHTETISGDVTAVGTRTLYVAAGAQADATGDGGMTWQTWEPGAAVTVRSTPEVAPLTHTYFGLSDGKLYRSDDALVSEPTLVHTFPSSVECIWVNEANAVRVWVGLANGEVWYTVQADLLAEAVWLEAVDFPSRVNWVVESYAADGQVRACAGENVYVTYDGFGTYGVLTTLAGGEAKRVALSFFGNYASGEAASPVVHEDSSAVGFPGAVPADVRITAFAAEDALLALDEDGHAWVKDPGASSFRAAADTGIGPAGHVVRDGEQTKVFYAAGEGGVVKTYDAAETWVLLRDYATVPLYGYQIGYAAAPMVPPVRLAFVERASNTDFPEESVHGIPDNGTIVASICTNPSSPLIQDPPPTGWQLAAFDDSVPWSTAPGSSHPWAEPTTAIPFGSSQRHFRAHDHWPQGANHTHTHEQALFRHVFTLPAAPSGTSWARATLELYNLRPVGGGANQHDAPIEAYVNGTALPCSGTSMFRYLDPDLLVADGTTENCIAVRAGACAGGLPGHRAAWKLTLANHDEVVSLSTGNDGALYWRPTGECAFTLLAPEDVLTPGWNGPASAGELPTASRYRCFNFLDPSAPVGVEHAAFGYAGQPGYYTGASLSAVDRATWRHPVLLPASSSGGPYREAQLVLTLPGGGQETLAGAWLNGQALPVAAAGTHDLDPTLLIPGGWNVLCFLMQATAAWTPWVSYLVRIVP